MHLEEQIFSPGWRVVQLCLLEVLSLLVLGDNKFAIWLRGQRLLLSLGCTFDNMDLFQLQLGLYKTWQDFGHAPLFCKEITVVSFTVSGENESSMNLRRAFHEVKHQLILADVWRECCQVDVLVWIDYQVR